MTSASEWTLQNGITCVSAAGPGLASLPRDPLQAPNAHFTTAPALGQTQLFDHGALEFRKKPRQSIDKLIFLCYTLFRTQYYNKNGESKQ